MQRTAPLLQVGIGIASIVVCLDERGIERKGRAEVINGPGMLIDLPKGKSPVIISFTARLIFDCARIIGNCLVKAPELIAGAAPVVPGRSKLAINGQAGTVGLYRGSKITLKIEGIAAIVPGPGMHAVKRNRSVIICDCRCKIIKLR